MNRNVINRMTVAGVGVVLLGGSMVALATPARSVLGIGTTLEQIKETRAANLVDDGAMDYFDRPALSLQFRVDLPKGRSLVDVGKPLRLVATDATGTDLTKVAADGPFGAAPFVSMTASWDGPPTGFTMALAPAARTAETFDLEAELSAVTYGETRTENFPINNKWTDLSDRFGGETISGRLEAKSGGTQFAIKPGTMRDSIESIEVKVGNKTLESEGVMWNDLGASFMFAGQWKGDARVEIVVRRDLERVPLIITLDDQPLP